ncbi:MAG: respiratory nitrate reductase subunit gamma [Deltaproteobacteria bacterium]|nr:respiratory nitrate reductase subunit gamma [Deltaproteobacteria bacterium]
MGFYTLSYLCIFVFILATSYRVYRQLTLPMHVRWEIYPVQHETTDKLVHGGSYMEDLNWWEKKQSGSLFNELKYMVPEILFLRGLRKENRSLWRVSFPFHFGLYLMIATFAMLILHALFVLWAGDTAPAVGAIRTLLDGLIVFTGWIGLILGVIGSVGTHCRRLVDPELREYSSFMDYFNILFILLFFLFAFLTCLFVDPLLQGAKAYVFGLLTGGGSLNSYVPGQTFCGGVAIVLASLLVAYVPLTHMSHMFMKYFLYHNVKWDDAPNRRGGAIEAAILKSLELKPTWKAKHVEADGRKSWLNISSSVPKEMK